MFQDRGHKRTFYGAPQSVTSLVAAFLELTPTVHLRRQRSRPRAFEAGGDTSPSKQNCVEVRAKDRVDFETKGERRHSLSSEARFVHTARKRRTNTCGRRANRKGGKPGAEAPLFGGSDAETRWVTPPKSCDAGSGRRRARSELSSLLKGAALVRQGQLTLQ